MWLSIDSTGFSGIVSRVLNRQNKNAIDVRRRFSLNSVQVSVAAGSEYCSHTSWMSTDELCVCLWLVTVLAVVFLIIITRFLFFLNARDVSIAIVAKNVDVVDAWLSIAHSMHTLPTDRHNTMATILQSVSAAATAAVCLRYWMLLSRFWQWSVLRWLSVRWIGLRHFELLNGIQFGYMCLASVWAYIVRFCLKVTLRVASPGKQDCYFGISCFLSLHNFIATSWAIIYIHIYLYTAVEWKRLAVERVKMKLFCAENLDVPELAFQVACDIYSSINFFSVFNDGHLCVCRVNG